MNTEKICFFIPEITGGGAERVVCELSSCFVKQGKSVTIMLLQDTRRDYVVDSGVEIFVLPTAKNKIKQKLVRIKAIRNFLKSNPGCVFVSFLYRTLVYALFATRGVSNTWIVSERNNPRVTPAGRLHRWIRNVGFFFADKCVFQTEDAKQYFSKRVQKKGVIIPNPIRDVQPKRIPNDQHIIMNACRFSKQKNLPLLINAFAEIHALHPEYTLILYGDGGEKATLQKQIAECNLTDCVKMPGFASDIQSCYREAEIFVTSSDYEGISNSMLEAMSIGLPVISTDCPIGGARMMIRHEENGLLVPVGNQEELVKAMLRLIEDRAFAEQVSHAAIETCKSYSLEHIATQWEHEMR